MSTSTNDRSFPPWGRRMVLASRVVILLLVTAITAVSGQAANLLIPLAALIALATVMSLPLRPAWSAVSPLVEAALAAAIVASASTLPEPLLPYLVVPPLAAGLLRGVRATLLTSTATAVTLLGVRAVSGSLGSVADRTALVQWVGLGLAVGLVGAWGRWSTLRAIENTDAYVEANRLLTQLRDIARALPAGFDEVSIGARLLTDIRQETGISLGIVSLLTDAGHLAPLTSIGEDRAMWGAGPPEGPWQRALETRDNVSVDRTLSDSSGYTALFPLRLGDRVFGVVAVSRPSEPLSKDELRDVARRVDDAALRLDTGQLFSDVRAVATVEERRRMSREIHDGVAQELAGLGFVIDDLATHTSDPHLQSELATVRAELTRMITELRLSIFDLRTHVEPGIGLGTALSNYVRHVGTMANLTVHLVLDEDIRRLSVETETELLRIAQEAIANARRHAHAHNLWVTLRVNPPHAFLRVADDGRGLGLASDTSYGLDIMRERANRIGADFVLRSRPQGGTVVEVDVGTAHMTDAHHNLKDAFAEPGDRP